MFLYWPLGSDWVGFVSWVSPLKSDKPHLKERKQNNIKKLFNVLQLKPTDKTIGKCSGIMQIDCLSYYSSISEKCKCQQKSGTGWCEILGGRERHLFPLIIKEAVRKLPGRNCVSEQAHRWKPLPWWVPGVSLDIITAMLHAVKCAVLDEFGVLRGTNRLSFLSTTVLATAQFSEFLGWALEILVEKNIFFLFLEALFRLDMFIAYSSQVNVN